jgi:hypothetical protein
MQLDATFRDRAMLDMQFWDTIWVKILSIEEVHRGRRKNWECTAEAHIEVQRVIIGIK